MTEVSTHLCTWMRREEDNVPSSPVTAAERDTACLLLPSAQLFIYLRNPFSVSILV